MELLKYCNHRTLFLAFNKSIQTEIQEKIESKGLNQGKALTVHSLGLSAIRKKYPKLKVNKGKNYKLLKILEKENEHLFKSIKEWDKRLSMIYTLMDMNDISRLFLTDDINVIEQHYAINNNTIDRNSVIDELWDKLVKIRYDSYKESSIDIDFIDMIYLPVVDELEIPVYPSYLFIDECQDLNLLQHRFIEQFINQGTIKKWVAVGDRYQSIYLFAGAYSKSFNLFLEKDNVIELPLDICYRCPKKIIDEANKVYNIMQYGKEEEGSVVAGSVVANIEQNSMVICRNTRPLIALYFNLIKLGKHCYIKGDDILQSTIRFMKPYSKYTISSAIVEMNYTKMDLMDDTTDKGKIKLAKFEENYSNFIKLSENMCTQTDTVENLINHFKELFNKKDNDAICLCTIHKAKGLEADVVYFLNQELIPSKYANTLEQLKQEENLRYVAITRAKKKLVYFSPEQTYERPDNEW